MVRSFTTDPVPRDALDLLVRQCLAGPSAGNTRSLQLLILTGEAVDGYWATTLPVERRAGFPWPGLLLAPLLIVPYVEPMRYVERYGESDKQHAGLGRNVADWPVPYWWVDGGAAAQTVLLGAVAQGLGACLFGQFDHESAIRARFGVPDGMRAVGTIAVGYESVTERRPSSSTRRDRRPRDEVVHWNVW